jgi:hypothetical protein
LTEKWKLLKSEQALRMHAGWSKTSKMVEIYTHEFGNESSEMLLQAYGIIPTNGHENNILKPRQCPNCAEPNKPESQFCMKCRMVLTYSAYHETLEKEQKRESELNDLKKKLEAVQEDQNQKFNQIMAMIQKNPKLANIKPEVLATKSLNFVKSF